MSNYRSEAGNLPAVIGQGFAAKMRECLNRKIKMGIDGIDRASIYEKKRPADIVHRNHDMQDEVFDLGCKIHHLHQELDYRQWVAWMTDTNLIVRHDSVTIYVKDAFNREYIIKNIGPHLSRYYSFPVEYRIDPAIVQRVNA